MQRSQATALTGARHPGELTSAPAKIGRHEHSDGGSTSTQFQTLSSVAATSTENWA